jgi:microcystin-dependent protein
VGHPYIGEIRMFAGNFAPAGWMFCEGQILPISENDTLFELIGTTYGGDGQSTFGLPDLRGRIPVHQGNGFVPAQMGGVEDVTLTVAQMANHTHQLGASQNAASSTQPAGAVLAGSTGVTITPYGTDQPWVQLSPSSSGTVVGSQPHTNMQPYLCVSFIISLFGVYPTQK